MVEPVSVTLGALALLDPAIRAVRNAYGVYKLTAAFGEHYIAIQRRLLYAKSGAGSADQCAAWTYETSLPSLPRLDQIHRQSHW